MAMAKEDVCPPKSPKTVEQLKLLLDRAIELEHVLMSAYLFTSYTLKQDPSEGGFANDADLRAEEVTAVEAWREAIMGVAVQEMLHMALGANMLSAIGGDPAFSRRGLSFPISPDTLKRRFGYDGRAWLGLWPFSELTIKRFVWFEAFEHEEFPGPPYDASIPVFKGPEVLEGLEDMEISSLVELYEAIACGFVHLDKTLGPKKLFPPERRLFQVTDQEVTGLFNFPPALDADGNPRPLLTAVTDLQSALAAINTIIVQGEGDTAQWDAFVDQLKIPRRFKVFPTIQSQSHHETFLQILLGSPTALGYYELKLADSAFDPVRRVPQNPLAVSPCGDKACRRHVHLIRDRFTRRMAELFDDLYDVVVNLLSLGYAQQGAKEEDTVNEYAKGTLIQSSIRAMVYIVSPLGNALTQLPGDKKERWFAGPGFVFKKTDGDWNQVADRLAELSERARRLGSRAPDREIWVNPDYLGIPPAGSEYPRESVRDLLCKQLAPDLLFMSDRLRRVEGNAPNPEFELHVCQGLNACAGQDITGTATEAGAGMCATADPHVCSGQNHCKGQGGCGFSPAGTWALQNHPGQNDYPGQVLGPNGFFMASSQADSACGSPILPSLQNTFGFNTPPSAGRGGSDEVYGEAGGYVWDFARKLFEERMRARGIPFDESFDGIDRYRDLCPESDR